MSTVGKRFLKVINKMQPGQVILLGFAMVILIGSLLLTLPFATKNGQSVSYIDALFTSTSAVCVTGLVVVDTGNTYNLFGQIVVILLIQVGGLGFMTVATMFSVFTRKKINLRERLIIQESFNQFDLSGLVKLVKYAVSITILVELIGAAVLATVFIPQFGIPRGVWFSIFHSISAFCNAGFDVMGPITGSFSSITSYVDNLRVTLTIGILIIIGGIGFPVILNVARERKFSKFNLHTKLVLITTFVLVFVGMFLILAIEYNNNKTLGNLGIKGKLLGAFFQSVTCRTAGYSSVNLASLKESTMLVMIILMFMGASPASTGGGVKTTTIAVLFVTIKSFLLGKSDIEVYERKISSGTVKKALGMFVVGISVATIATLIISITQDQTRFNVIASAFEVVSAFATVGSSIAGSSHLNLFGKIVIILCMYMGRVGALTMFMAVLSRGHKNKPITYPEGRIIVG